MTGKNIVLLSDAAGTLAEKGARTNALRLFRSIDLRASDQTAIYTDMRRVVPLKPLAIAARALGWGLKRNVLALYVFLCRHYEPDARIFAFGFGQGAFAIRVLLGLIATQGLVPYRGENDLKREALAAYRAYRAQRFHTILHLEAPLRALRDIIVWLWSVVMRRRPYDRSNNIPRPEICFVGLWDTVPFFDVLGRAFSRGVSHWLWASDLPDRFLANNVRRAAHALALDESSGLPALLWSEQDEQLPHERVIQVWFPGTHATVGGLYSDDPLSDLPLQWIMHEAIACGLRFRILPSLDYGAALNARASADQDAAFYDPRQGIAAYYRYGPRNLAELSYQRFSRRIADSVVIDLPKIHESAVDGTVHGSHSYAPIGIPARYSVVMQQGGAVLAPSANPFETTAQAATRANAQERVWDLVWWRRVLHAATLTSSLHLAIFPVLYRTSVVDERSSPLRPISEAIRAVGEIPIPVVSDILKLLPGTNHWWIDAFASNPGRFVAGLVALILMPALGAMVARRINTTMHSIWRMLPEYRAAPRAFPTPSRLYRLRTHRAYVFTHRVMTGYIVPFASAVLLVYVGMTALSHLAFDLRDAAGAFCHGSPGVLARVDVGRPAEATFKASAICGATGIELVDGRRYRLTLKEPKDWRDRTHPSPLAGLEIGELPNFAARVRMASAIPMRRVLNKPWFRPIARIGAVGADEYPLDPVGTTAPHELVAEITARRSGELFLYVNDAVLAVPGAERYFYANNWGEATVTVSRFGR